MIYLHKYTSLTELTSYEKFTALIIALGFDIFLFQTGLGIETIVVISMLFVSSVILTGSRKSMPRKHNILFKYKLLLAFCSGAFIACQASLYKTMILEQGSALQHLLIAESICFTFYCLISYKSLISAIKSLPLKYPLFIGLVMFIATILEAFAYESLPISLVLTLGISGTLISILYDVKFKEFSLNTKNLFAIVLIMSALLLLILP